MSIAALVAADDDDGDAAAGDQVHVSLTEFAITPNAVTATAGGIPARHQRRHGHPQPRAWSTPS